MTENMNESVETLEQDDAVIGRAFRMSLAVIVGAALLIGGAVLWLNREAEAPAADEPPVVLPQQRDRANPAMPTLPFTDVTEQAGIDFVHVSGAAGEKLLPETMGGGAAFFDFDNDGDQDLLLINGKPWPWASGADDPSSAAPAPAADPAPTAALYENDGKGNFRNVTAGSGLDVPFYGQGVAVGDYDSDGRVDVFISCVGGNALFRNLGEGRFEDVTSAANVRGDDEEWSSSAAFVDVDNDGDLDLFVCNYIQWSRDVDIRLNFQLVGVGRAYGPPIQFKGTQSYLYRNEGDGTFTDVSKAAGVHVVNRDSGAPVGKALGVRPIDVDRDGRIDLLVANDMVRNFLFRNRGDGTFEEIGERSGFAFGASGKARAGMGIDTADLRRDGAVGVAIGNFANEMTALYVSKPATKSVFFTDDAVATGVGPPTRLELTFGVCFLDADLDGRLDLVCANGHLEEEISRAQAALVYHQSPRLLWNAGEDATDEFVSLPEDKGGDFFKPIVGRALAYADIDGDGDLDVLFTQVNARPVLLRNDQQLGRHWLRVRLIGDPARGVNRNAVGARIEARIGDDVIRREVMPARSYISQVELPATLGLGDATKVDELIVIWPNGQRQTVEVGAVDRVIEVRME